MTDGEIKSTMNSVVVERVGTDLFRITWWRRNGETVEELARAASLSRRVAILAMRDSAAAGGVPQSPDYDPASVAFRHGSAVEIAHAEGAADYGNPVTPHCATSGDHT